MKVLRGTFGAPENGNRFSIKQTATDLVRGLKITGHSTREMFLRYDPVDTSDTRKAVFFEQMGGFLKSVEQNVDQAPLKQIEG